MQPGTHRFVLLRFGPEQEERPQAAIPLLIVQTGGKLSVHIEPQWESGFDRNDREYLSGLLDDWSDASEKEIPAILDQLSELSIGPLRAVESGVADSERLRTLLRQFPSGN